MGAMTSQLTTTIQERERAAQETFDSALRAVNAKVAIVALLFLFLVIGIGLAVSRSISLPLGELRQEMDAIVRGDYHRRVANLEARDEIAEMARAVEVFRANAIAKREAEAALRTSKEHAESALSELRDTQTSLIEAEKLAALGSLVAGVAHEVNNPVGISLTVASSLARRCDEFERETESGAVRRSRLSQFVAGNRDAANQLVTNLHRAGELIQAFKQVAVDRSHADRRSFELKESIDQIVSSLAAGPEEIADPARRRRAGRHRHGQLPGAARPGDHQPVPQRREPRLPGRRRRHDQHRRAHERRRPGPHRVPRRRAPACRKRCSARPSTRSSRPAAATAAPGSACTSSTISSPAVSAAASCSRRWPGAGTTFRINLPRVAPREELHPPAMAMSLET